MNCPRCDVGLEEVKVDEVVLDRCPDCGGLWFDFALLERVLSRESRALKALLPERKVEPSDEPIRCPRCGETLIPMTASPGRVRYYTCLTCYGRWLDGVELERLVGRSLAIKFETLFQELLG